MRSSNTDVSSCSSINSEDSVGSLRTNTDTGNTKSPFLLELERFRKGQKLTRQKPKRTQRGKRQNSGTKHNKSRSIYKVDHTQHQELEHSDQESVSDPNDICVINLSDKVLDMDQLSVLNKGLGFVPTSIPDYTELHINLFKFVRKCKLFKYFSDKQNKTGVTPIDTTPCPILIEDIKDIHTLLSLEDNDDVPTHDQILSDLGWDSTDTCVSGLKPASRFVPVLPTDSAIYLFYNWVTKDLYQLEARQKNTFRTIPQNITTKERAALRTLIQDKDIPKRACYSKRGTSSDILPVRTHFQFYDTDYCFLCHKNTMSV
ncbi:hypothetical protein NDU88_003949 [Pleurodeles waltl]|uniref:Uncharacterized protein n=1 Tax=Pleurodeles waltl TaxID=8319 RepID=A0AAV7PBH4_PLEWA|nr:hypothetical protein NDU88_003949 [Pleurodeles waltl]